MDKNWKNRSNTYEIPEIGTTNTSLNLKLCTILRTMKNNPPGVTGAVLEETLVEERVEIMTIT